MPRSGASALAAPITIGIRRGSASSGPSRSRARERTTSAATSVPTSAMPRSASTSTSTSPGSASPSGGTEQKQRERGDRDDLEHHEIGEQRERLRDQHRGAVDGREQEAVEPALLGVRDEEAVDAEQRGEQERDDEDSRGEVAFDAPAVEREVKDDKRADREQATSRDGLERPQLDRSSLRSSAETGGPEARAMAYSRRPGRGRRRAPAARPERAASPRDEAGLGRERAHR